MSKRTHIVLPVELVADIDQLVGKRGRSAFIAEVAQREIKLRRQREALRETGGAWKTENHPELAPARGQSIPPAAPERAKALTPDF